MKPALPFASVFLVTLTAACGSDRGSNVLASFPGAPDGAFVRPDGTAWIVDPSEGGQADGLHLEELRWGRLVDVRDQDGILRHRDLLVEESVEAGGATYRVAPAFLGGPLEVTVSASFGSPAWHATLEAMKDEVEVVRTRGFQEDLPPFTAVPRNAALELRFSDLLDPTTIDAQTVQVRTGLGLDDVHEARILPDPNHGGLAAGRFLPSRVLVDLAVERAEALATGLPLNPVGVPGSTTTALPNLGLALPTRSAPGAGQFRILTNPAGKGLAASGSGPVDLRDPARPLQRAMRSGGRTALTSDAGQGFLADSTSPRLVGEHVGQVTGVTPVAGSGGMEFLVDFQFLVPACAKALQAGEVVEQGGLWTSVVQPSGPPVGGLLTGLHLRVNAGSPAHVQAGRARAHSLYDPAAGDALTCFVGLEPRSAAGTAAGISPATAVELHFDEPVDLETDRLLDAVTLSRHTAWQGAGLGALVVGDVEGAFYRQGLRFVPRVPLDHAAGQAEAYHVDVAAGAVTDLAGNPFAGLGGPLTFTLDPGAAPLATGGLTLRFEAPNEDGDTYQGAPLNEYAGQFVQDVGAIRPRPIQHLAFEAGRNQAVPGIMVPLTNGVQTPITPLGSRMMGLYRYLDLGVSVFDPAYYNLDVEGMSWAPLGGQVVADHHPEFEINLAHTPYLPDEKLNDLSLLPAKPASGLIGTSFLDNVLGDPVKDLVNVHPKAMGYTIDPADQHLGASGTLLMPWPMNQGAAPADLATYTWRDTSRLDRAAPQGNGAPTRIERQVGLIDGVTPGQRVGDLAASGEVPTIGLPLLVEFKCYPSATGLGLNSLDAAIAINTSPRPYFRVFSSGGFDTTGAAIIKNPDTEIIPTGGFNADPTSHIPLGAHTFPADNVFHYGQLDLVVRVSRAHTRWLDTGFVAPSFAAPLVDADLPPGTSLSLHYRGATKVKPNSQGELTKQADLSADYLDAYGDEGWKASQVDPYPLYGPDFWQNPSVKFLGQDTTWKDAPADVDGAQWIQARFTLVSDLATGEVPRLKHLGLAFTE